MSEAPLIGGRYRLDREIRRTDRVTAYAATDAQSSLPVTVKLLRADLTGQPAYRRALEARLAVVKGVSAAWAAPLLDFELDGPQPFLVERGMAGRTVGDRIRAGETFTPTQLTELATGAEDALRGLHGSLLGVHGGLLPDTLLVAGDGQVMLLDTEQPPGPVDSVERARYAAPELLADDPLGPQGDVHSLACILYHAALGRPPFDGTSPASVSANKQRGKPDAMSVWRPDVPPALATAILAGLQADPAMRPATLASGVGSALAGATVALGTADLGATQAMGRTVQLPPRPVFDAAAAMAAPPVPQPQPRTREGGGWGPVVAVAITLVVIAALYFGLVAPPGTIRVPPLNGLSEQQALDKLKEVQLVGTQVDSQWDDRVPDGQVLRQDPAAGARLKAGEKVKITLSRGSHNVQVPDVRNLTEKEAKAALGRADLKFGSSSSSQRPDAPDGVVVDVIPRAGSTVQRGATVDLVVNKRPKDEPVKAAAEPTKEPEPPKDANGNLLDKLKDQAGAVIDKGKETARDLTKAAEKKVGDAIADKVKETFGGGSDKPKGDNGKK